MEMSKMASSIDWLFEYFVGLQGFSFLTHDMRFFQLYTTFSVKKNFPLVYCSYFLGTLMQLIIFLWS